ncbi:hypothetical protein [Arthrobacter sp. IK3]|uniref:hypothetical protein n=1 Tax=Arthrobacter sp. IK3 TaxID=3448169 RepID=UPI003EE35903
MDQQDIDWVNRWVVSLCEPLVTTAARREIDEHVADIAARQPLWISAWASGLVSDLVRSLDPEDPWRNLEVASSGAVMPDGSPFGTWVDATDIVPPSVPDRRADVGLAAVDTGLSGRASEFVAVAAGGWRPAFEWIRENLVTAPALDGPQAAELLDTVDGAIRWAMFRRRLFAGQDDPFIPVDAAAWTTRAGKMISGEAWDEARAARVLESNKIQPGTYAQFV